jgi:hypothetical protein
MGAKMCQFGKFGFPMASVSDRPTLFAVILMFISSVNEIYTQILVQSCSQCAWFLQHYLANMRIK